MWVAFHCPMCEGGGHGRCSRLQNNQSLECQISKDGELTLFDVGFWFAMAPRPTESNFVAACGFEARAFRAYDDAPSWLCAEWDGSIGSDEPVPAMSPGREVKYLRSRASATRGKWIKGTDSSRREKKASFSLCERLEKAMVARDYSMKSSRCTR